MSTSFTDKITSSPSPISYASIAAFFALFATLNYLGQILAFHIVKKQGIDKSMKKKIVKYVGLSINTIVTVITIGSGLWYCIKAWEASNGDTLIEGTDVYLIFVECNVAFFLSELICGDISVSIRIHHLICVFAYLATLEEHKLAWYSAIASLNESTYLFSLLLYIFYKSERGEPDDNNEESSKSK
ncbi:predicted protein [Naegleria gruberi]|uniref:Predicted protein n=1 Tax=Naegleria gruberi TaxID=5762 RepID=D2W069_NAEGR|nr:uncharacterized protein NAEGRDRAFT_74752 [Naegleria gruberi]EFC37564.1 predicted protein [Naegleria gruberi]|eukprot:XP_002670308.1 predicted protein [Naegleria gruberi strain NEG-M]